MYIYIYRVNPKPPDILNPLKKARMHIVYGFRSEHRYRYVIYLKAARAPARSLFEDLSQILGRLARDKHVAVVATVPS